MNFTDLRFSFEAMQWLMTVAIGTYSWFISRQAASAKELLDLRSRIITLEEAVRHSPSHNQVTELQGDMKAVKVEMQTLSESISRMNDYFMRNK